MAVKYGKFELPSKIKVDEQSRTSTFARFIAEAFERGYGHTVGNLLRRIMLSSLRRRQLSQYESKAFLMSTWQLKVLSKT